MARLDVVLPEIPGVSHRWVAVGGLRMHVAEAGAGDPLLLVHGWPQNWFCWRRVVPLLTDRYRLIMPDLRGHGWSEAPRFGYDKEQLATDLLTLLGELGLDSVGYVGHDWGGWAGFLACLRAPTRFRGLVAVGIVPPFQPLTLAKVMQAWRGAYQVALSTPLLAAAMLRSSPRFVAAGIRAATVRRDAFSAADLELYGSIMQEPARAAATVQLYRTFLLREVPTLNRYLDQRLVVPTRLLIGDGDPIGSPATLDGWHNHAEDMTIDGISGAGHFLPEEAPDEVAATVRALFKR
jgi:pimeloyl-ACP methyl ester carboxylesterase